MDAGAYAERIRDASARRAPLRLRGGGSKDFYGGPLAGELLDVSGHTGIVSYEPTELVVTARCGTPLAELEAALARERQQLAFEPPRFAAGAGGLPTLGGCIAAGLSGPRRASAGAVRDFLLGVRLIDGRGRELAFGGQVMKNVAGYDVSRLVAGSLGTLGLLLEVSLKVLPRPPAEVTLVLEMPQARAIEQVNRWAGSPLPVSATAWVDNSLAVRLSGSESGIRSAVGQVGGERMGDGAAARYWEALRDHTDPFFAAGEVLWRLSLPSNAPAVELPGAQLIEWNGAQRWLRTGAEPARVRDVAARAGGHATLFRGGDRASGAFAPLSPALARLHRGLKAAFDPDGILNPGRLYPDF